MLAAEPLNICILQPRPRQVRECPIAATEKVIALMQAAVEQHGASSVGPNVIKTLDSLQIEEDPAEMATMPVPTAAEGLKKDQKIDLMLLPELCPVGYSEDSFSKYLPNTAANQALHREIDLRLRRAAQRLNCAICYGTIGWKGSDDDESIDARSVDGPLTRSPRNYNETTQFFIRQIVLDATGRTIGSYDKINTCNYGDCKETRFFSQGNSPFSFQLPRVGPGGGYWTLGLMICADMRCPGFARNLVQNHGVHVILQPACFARDQSFRTWKSFRETRAVENGVYFLASNYAGDYFGESSISPPWIDENNEPTVLGSGESYLLATLEEDVLHKARSDLPFYSHTMKAHRSCCDNVCDNMLRMSGRRASF